ncbi:MAG: redoxin family protein [Candidatus Spechtbacterales bacterium]|nr:redoxin family protein [Candidatus Spechtbacterales bacterium]
MKRIQRNIGLVIVSALVVAGIIYFEGQGPPNIGTTKNAEIESIEGNADKASKYPKAKEIVSPSGFINTGGEEITIEELIGKKVILVDFWTYSCINCQRTFPYLNNWYEKYSEEGLEIVGIHTPEFDFEKDYENVTAAVEKFNIEYPVVLDNDYATWQAYSNRYWPRKYLIDIDGYIVYDHIGEGAYEETEGKIVELLNERSQQLGMGEVEMKHDAPENVDNVDFTQVKTPETYLGYKRLEYIHEFPRGTCYGNKCNYELPQNISLNEFAFGGEWFMGPENSELRSDEGDILIKFSANKVNLVAGAPEGARAEIYLDGEKISSENSGFSVSDGIVEFNDHALYNLVDLGGNYGEHTLRIHFLEPEVSVFAFTFG